MPESSKSLAVWAWVLYDFANTIFSVSILTVFFPLWVNQQIGDGAWLVNLATAVSALSSSSRPLPSGPWRTCASAGCPTSWSSP